MVAWGMLAPGTTRLMKAAFLADLSRNTPASTGRPNGPAISPTKRLRASLSVTIWVWRKRAPAACLRAVRLFRPLQLGDWGSAAAPANRAVGPSGKSPCTGSMPALSWATSCNNRTASSSFTARAWGWSPARTGSPVRQSTLRSPKAWAPSRSACRPMRLRSRHATWSTGSTPASSNNRHTARLLIRITARLPSVTLTACTQPRRA